MKAGFDSDGFKKYQTELASEQFNRTIGAIKALNNAILQDDSLGEDFCIGHSHFCGQKSFDKTWLSNVIYYGIAPMLEEYWFDSKDKCKQEIGKLAHTLDD